MPPLCSNPYDAAQPDFATEAHADAQLALTEGGLSEAQAIESLTHLWTLSNKHEKAEWDRAIAEEQHTLEEARQAATDAEECQHQQSQADKEAALAEECKKHKSKFTPVPNAKVPVEPLCIPLKK
ncbi:hypothetical protein ID866_11813 [Astraeus odoratus]|nr:hypothetical protein ID866_11813 [Astraeus odoratus]